MGSCPLDGAGLSANAAGEAKLRSKMEITQRIMLLPFVARGELYQIDDYIQEACRDEAHLGALAAGAGPEEKSGGASSKLAPIQRTSGWGAYRPDDGGGKSLTRVAFEANGKLCARWRSLKAIASAAQARQVSTTANLANAPRSTA